MAAVDVYLEVGKSRTLAGAINWPGWCRSGRDADAALQTLFEYAPRYGRVLSRARLNFTPPSDLAALRVVERVPGASGADFGVPEAAPSADSRPVSESDLERFTKVLRACWRSFDGTVDAARGKPLRKGARGGGRDLDAIVSHVLDGDGGYLWRLASQKRGDITGLDRPAQLEFTRKALLDALTASAHGQLPLVGPRGGKRWTARYAVRRVAWHVLDHAWEIEDRCLSGSLPAETNP
jgi:hypothetical protein